MILFCSVFFIFNCVVGLSNLYHREYYWNLFEYDIDGVNYTNDSDYEHKMGSFFAYDELNEYEKFFIQKNVVPYSMVYIVHGYIISIPRTRPGIPYTLNVFDTQYFTGIWNPQLKPYPNSKEATNIVSVYSLGNFGCTRLSFVDTGFIDIPGHRKQIQPPQLQVYNLYKNKLSFSYEIDQSFLQDGITSGLRSAVEHNDFGCDKPHFYISDVYTNDVIVFSLEERKFSKIHRSKHGDEAWAFPVPPNIVHLVKEVVLFSAVNKNQSYENYKRFYEEKSISGKDKTLVMVLDSLNPNPKGVIYALGLGIVYFTNVDRTKLYCWNIQKSLVNENVVLLTQASDANDFYIVGVDVSGFYFGMMVARFRKNGSQGYDNENVNFELYKSHTQKLTTKTNCGEIV